MNLYLVGGAVRDQLLGLPVTEKDWVVVGAAAEEMLQQGFQQVGKDFPVFLHPKTHEEYALARRERKVGRGYTGFAFDASPNVTLEDDLKRRDLTINAMAQTMDGRLIDPYGGEKDLQQKLLRHVSDAFVEDPVRILRVGRFAARFFELGFKVAPETLALMKNMVQSGEVSALVPERVWKELERALLENHPEQFFQLLADCGAAAILFPHDLDLNALQRAVGLSKEGDIRFAALCQKLTETQLNDWCDRFRIPNEYRELALLVIKFAKYYPDLKNAAAESILQFLYAADAFRREERFKKFLLACEACYACSPPLLDYLQAAKTVHIQEMPPEIKGKAIADYLYKKRLEKIEQLGKSGC